MRRLISFTFQSLDGYYKGPNEDIAWNRHGPNEVKFSEDQLARGHTLVFGRRTYEHMAAFWPTPAAAAHLPAIAAAMNRADKVVVSNSLRAAAWGPARIIAGDVVAAFQALKSGGGRDLTILGSGELVSFLAGHGLIDAFEVMIYPVAIGGGTALFSGQAHWLPLKLTETRTFASGTVLLTYEPDVSGAPTPR